MSSTETSSAGSAAVQGDLWGARPAAWAEHEPQGTPIFEAVLEAARVASGTRLLDVGCASGVLCRLAADRGAEVSGLDAAESLVERARERVPKGRFRRGDLQSLPYEDASFDVVTGVNSFQFAADPVEALREAGRVAADGHVVAAVWGPQADVDLFTVVGAVASLVPGPAMRRPLLAPGGIEHALGMAGLSVRATSDGRAEFHFTDGDDLLRQLTAAGGTVRAIRTVGEARVRAAILEAAMPFQEADGGYRLVNAWHFVVAARPTYDDA